MYDPRYLSQDTVAKAEILLFDLKSDRLVWSALSETSNPSSNRGLVREVASKVINKLEEENLINK